MKQINLYKQKIFYYLSTLIFLSIIISCGVFFKSGNNSSNNIPVDIYVGGSSGGEYSADRVAVYWKNGEMIPLSTKRSEVTSIAVINNYIYMGGYYCIDDASMIQADGDMSVPIAGYWKNGKWVSLSNAKYGSSVHGIFVSSNDVYACGWISTREDVRFGGYWKNSKWVGLSNTKNGSSVGTIFLSNNDVYLGGYIKEDHRQIPGYWKNGEWVSFNNAKYGSAVCAIFVSGNDVYAGGTIMVNYIMIPGYWKNGEWVALQYLSERKVASVFSIFVSGNDVYAGGYSRDNSGINIACYWKNGKIIPLMLSEPKFSCVNSIFVFGKDVYAAGYSRDSDGLEIPGYWKNGEWVRLVAKGYSPSVTSIFVVPRPTVQ